MPRTPMDLIPVDVSLALQRSFRLNGSLDIVSGAIDYEGSVEIHVDAGGLGELVKKAMLQHGHTAKAGPVTVRFRGAASTRRHAPAKPAGEQQP